ncbi:hypothetical protein BC940DRAFT_305321 [Gongronella butleri]|nr:hypothetical protein BC940DRAFT_305321 [Gongronella butleri]
MSNSHNVGHRLAEERPTLPPITSMDGFLRDRPPSMSSSATPSCSVAAAAPLPPWNTHNGHTPASTPPSASSSSTPPGAAAPLSAAMASTSLNAVSSSSNVTNMVIDQDEFRPMTMQPPHNPTMASLPTSNPTSSPMIIATANIHPAAQSDASSTSSRSNSTSSATNIDPNTLSSSLYHRSEPQIFHERRRSSSHESPTLRIDKDINEVIRQCHFLSDTMAQQKPMLLDQDYFSDSTNMRPWLDGMIGRANEVLNALLRLRKHQMAAEIMKLHGGQDQADSHSDLGQDNETITTTKMSGKMEGTFHTIRQKRRGRRAAFQGRCHSCNISETPEWRRGPDGARTLCNACGLRKLKHGKKKPQKSILGWSQMTHFFSQIMPS